MNEPIIHKNWSQFEHGRTIGQLGSEHGIILEDDSYETSARITLEQGGPSAPFAITCGISGWLVHTRFFASQPGAQQALSEMKQSLTHIVALIPEQSQAANDLQLKELNAALLEFIARFP